jgi:hypothetical protein
LIKGGLKSSQNVIKMQSAKIGTGETKQKLFPITQFPGLPRKWIAGYGSSFFGTKIQVNIVIHLLLLVINRLPILIIFWKRSSTDPDFWSPTSNFSTVWEGRSTIGFRKFSSSIDHHFRSFSSLTDPRFSSSGPRVLPSVDLIFTNRPPIFATIRQFF